MNYLITTLKNSNKCFLLRTIPIVSLCMFSGNIALAQEVIYDAYYHFDVIQGVSGVQKRYYEVYHLKSRPDTIVNRLEGDSTALFAELGRLRNNNTGQFSENSIGLVTSLTADTSGQRAAAGMILSTGKRCRYTEPGIVNQESGDLLSIDCEVADTRDFLPLDKGEYSCELIFTQAYSSEDDVFIPIRRIKIEFNVIPGSF